jgi:hypothetical protein
MTRRELLLGCAGAGVLSASRQKSEIAVEGYIFQQRAERLKQPLLATMPQVLPMVRAAGFRNIELNPAFFPIDGREQVLSVVRELGFLMPSLYVGGAMHETAAADRTIKD